MPKKKKKGKREERKRPKRECYAKFNPWPVLFDLREDYPLGGVLVSIEERNVVRVA